MSKISSRDWESADTVATICPEGEGRRSPGSSLVMSAIKAERYGENVKRDPMK